VARSFCATGRAAGARRHAHIAIALQHLGVCPNGFTINLAILENPHRGDQGANVMVLGAARMGSGDPAAIFEGSSEIDSLVVARAVSGVHIP
jgi:hypothetical protein